MATKVKYDRLIVVTDEQSQDGKAFLRSDARGYLVNVGPYQHGLNYDKPRNEVRYDGSWVHLTGFSENIIRFIAEFEKSEGVHAG